MRPVSGAIPTGEHTKPGSQPGPQDLEAVPLHQSRASAACPGRISGLDVRLPVPQAGVRILSVDRRPRAIEALVKVLAIEAAPIRVNALAPGQIDTRGGGGPMDEAAHRAVRELVARRLPLGRIGTAGEVAHAALFLAENTFTTGITLDIDGGKR